MGQLYFTLYLFINSYISITAEKQAIIIKEYLSFIHLILLVVIREWCSGKYILKQKICQLREKVVLPIIDTVCCLSLYRPDICGIINQCGACKSYSIVCLHKSPNQYITHNYIRKI